VDVSIDDRDIARRRLSPATLDGRDSGRRRGPQQETAPVPRRSPALCIATTHVLQRLNATTRALPLLFQTHSNKPPERVGRQCGEAAGHLDQRRRLIEQIIDVELHAQVVGQLIGRE